MANDILPTEKLPRELFFESKTVIIVLCLEWCILLPNEGQNGKTRPEKEIHYSSYKPPDHLRNYFCAFCHVLYSAGNAVVQNLLPVNRCFSHYRFCQNTFRLQQMEQATR
jgi:hypothetical protein